MKSIVSLLACLLSLAVIHATVASRRANGLEPLDPVVVDVAIAAIGCVGMLVAVGLIFDAVDELGGRKR